MHRSPRGDGGLHRRRRTSGETGGTYVAATTVTLDPVLPFMPAIGIYSYQAVYGGDVNNLGATGACEGPVRVVDANIQISPLTDSNAVGDTHVLTGHVNVNTGTGGYVNAPDGHDDQLRGRQRARHAGTAGELHDHRQRRARAR